jgi:SAM-dependent methyltransferase
MTKLTKAEARKTWEAAAPGWATWEKVVASGFRDATAQMLDMAAVAPGAKVLDLACGAGSQTFQAAERVGAEGAIVASDISATMLSHVSRRAEQRGVSNIETLECAAEDLDASHEFDAAICRLGLMLFPDPRCAARAVRSSLKPGGKFAALVFTTPPNNPFMSGPLRILLRHAGKEPPSPGQPGIFALGATGLLESALTESGYIEVETEVTRVRLSLESADAALLMMQGAFGIYRAAVADLSEQARNLAWSEVRDFLGRFESSSGWQTELEVVIAAGAAPR